MEALPAVYNPTTTTEGQLIEARSKRSKRQKRDEPTKSRAAFVIGAIVILSDGSQCQIAAITETQIFCTPQEAK